MAAGAAGRTRGPLQVAPPMAVLVVDGELVTRLPVDQPEELEARLEAAGLPQRTTT